MKGGNNVPNKLNDQGYDVLGELWDYSGEITALGLRSQFLLGRAYYQKYKGFISDSFKKKPFEFYCQIDSPGIDVGFLFKFDSKEL